MKSTGKLAALLLLAAFVTGCRHRTKAMPPAAAQAPTLPVYLSEANMPPPQLPPVELPHISPPSPPVPEQKPIKHRPAHHKVKHTEVQANQNPTPSQQAEIASNGGTSDITPIGQLTAAGESTNTPRRNQILDEINAIQKGLDNLKRPLSKDEQTTADQIRTFLTKARQALDQEDLDGAHILATKAKVLLTELTSK
ncbi:MAG TPA: hypothetical protein VMD58_02180 [Acidobacteriaceae bacterium]|nr:hypothetical protein [Acidobacteriaceae bacterium]